MLTEKPIAAPAPASRASGALTEPEKMICYFEGRFVPMSEAKVSIMTHAFMYGTAVFEGIRAYWNAADEQLYALKVREHVERIRNSCKIMFMEPIPSVDELTGLIVETARRNGFREDVYIRPSFYKSTKAIGVKLHGLEHQLYILSLPFGDYVDTTVGIKVGTVSWRRTSDTAMPSRAKIVGSYVNPAFSKTEAMLNGYDEAIVLTDDGHASEGSAENLFIIRDGVLITPPVTDDILEGITRAGIVEMAGDLGIRVVERSIDRSELYIADEVFLCGTGAQLSPVVEIDRRRVGRGGVGPVTGRLKDRYFDIVRGRVTEYAHWLTPVYEK
ncbi:MAG TPA: branched-chain amino acid transaminase [Candidatus Saccharimonadales bacterium]|nr:branched-chain amino acid transaminase [Candidatus Saccharimonadales bacterium]